MNEQTISQYQAKMESGEITARAIAEANELEIEFIKKQKAFRKEDRVKQIVVEQLGVHQLRAEARDDLGRIVAEDGHGEGQHELPVRTQERCREVGDAPP